MDGSTPPHECVICDRNFTPDKFNRSRQKCCGRSCCRRRMKQDNQRGWILTEKKRNPHFTARSRRAVAACRRRKRIAATVKESASMRDFETLTGLAATFSGESTSDGVVMFMDKCAEFGRRLRCEAPACASQ